MAANIFHGAPGSFKSASAFWFEVLPALRAGRVVVTNIEGIFTKDTIEIELGEIFPKSADVWRLSSQTEKGLFLWRRWFWWMPVKAFIIMDEVQDIFPNDSKVFKPEDLDNQGIESLKDKLPQKFYDYSVSERQKFTPPIDEGSVDDTGDLIIADDGFILYPRLMREANMRHRKYNWDIIYCTPEISEIHKLVRSVCEFAYFHKYNESLEFIPYFKRRPRIHEHSPKVSGIPKKKEYATKWRSVPVEVHKCYRSTSTGKVTKLGGINAFKDPSLIFAIALLSICFSYATWWLFIKDDRKSFQEISATFDKKDVQVSSKSIYSTGRVSRRFDGNSSTNENDVSLVLPYDAQTINFNGYVDVVLNKSKKYKEYFFTLIQGKNEIAINDTDLQYFGIKVHFINECVVKLISGELSRIVYCAPKIVQKPIKEPPSEPLLSL